MPLLKGPGSPLALAFAVALAGCGGGSSSSEGGSSSADSASSSGSSSSGSSSGSSGSSATSAGTGTSAVVTAAGAFLSTLGNSQKTVAGSTGSTSTVLFNLTRDNAIQWTNLPGSRHGLRLNTSTLTTAQLQAAETLMTTALSTAGKAEQDEIRAADDVLAASAGGYGSGLYSIAILGTPSTTSPWMLQIIGHHLAYNITYNGAYVSGTPAFLGVEPPNWVVTSSGSVVVNATASTAGTQHAPLETQRAALAALATALQANSTYKSGALLSGTYNDVVAGANGNTDSNFGALAYPTSGRGLLYASLDATAQGHVKAAIEAYVKTMPGDIADTLLATYESDTALAQTYVGYSPGQGGTADFGAYPNAQATPTSAQRSYIRIDGPRLWIEFVVQQGVVYRNYVHYHSIWRDKVADYGGQFGSGG